MRILSQYRTSPARQHCQEHAHQGCHQRKAKRQEPGTVDNFNHGPTREGCASTLIGLGCHTSRVVDSAVLIGGKPGSKAAPHVLVLSGVVANQVGIQTKGHRGSFQQHRTAATEIIVHKTKTIQINVCTLSQNGISTPPCVTWAQ